MPGIKRILFLAAAIILVSSSESQSQTRNQGENTKGGPGRADTLRVAIYRGTASCDQCSETVRSAIEKLGLRSQIDFVGPDEQIDISDNTLSHYDIYIQPGGGQDIPKAFKDLGSKRAEAIRHYISRGGRFLGICMGAYLADVSNLGLIDHELDTEVGRPDFPVRTIEDASVIVNWKGHKENIFFQDGPYLFPENSDKKYLKIAAYENGDLAAARYSYGNGLVILCGPHPEADSTWFEDAEIPMEERPAHDLFKDLIHSFYQ